MKTIRICCRVKNGVVGYELEAIDEGKEYCIEYWYQINKGMVSIEMLDKLNELLKEGYTLVKF